jgi:hypothetical protein
MKRNILIAILVLIGANCNAQMIYPNQPVFEPLDGKLYDVSTEVIVRGNDDVIQADPTLSPAMNDTFKVQDGEKIIFTADELRTITANRDRVYIIEINLGGVRVHILPSGL